MGRAEGDRGGKGLLGLGALGTVVEKPTAMRQEAVG